MTDPILEAAMRALLHCELEPTKSEAERVVAAVTPLIEAAALERAAKAADDDDGQFSYAGEHRNMAMLQQCCREIAAAIRALKEQP